MGMSMVKDGRSKLEGDDDDDDDGDDDVDDTEVDGR